MNNENKRTRTVKLTLTSKQILPEIVHRMSSLTLFDNASNVQQKDNEPDFAPEDYSDDMVDDALHEIYLNSMGLPHDDEDADVDYNYDDTAELNENAIDEIQKRLQELAEMVSESPAAEEDDAYVFCTLASMTEMVKDGHVSIEVAYAEEESLDGTNTIIHFEPSRPGMITIYRNGSIMSTLVCEKGVRHISSYQTPFMPLEAAIYTRKCEGCFAYESGGTIELDYIVEIRGAEMQRTIMKLEVVTIGD